MSPAVTCIILGLILLIVPAINKQYQTQDDEGYGRTHRVITEELPFRIGAEVGKLQFIFDQYLVDCIYIDVVLCGCTLWLCPCRTAA